MESSSSSSISPPPTIAKKLLHIFRVVYYMLLKGISKRKLMMDLNFLLKQGKIAGKALGHLLHPHHGHHGSSTAFSSFSCRSMDPNLSYYNPQEAEFSCSNTPAFPSLTKRKSHHRNKNRSYEYEAVAAIARAFEMMNNNGHEVSDTETSVAPSPMLFGKSPIMVRQLRITDSPFPMKEEEGVNNGKVDKEADEFIKRFYEQLAADAQGVSVETPEYRFRRG